MENSYTIEWNKNKKGNLEEVYLFDNNSLDEDEIPEVIAMFDNIDCARYCENIRVNNIRDWKEFVNEFLNMSLPWDFIEQNGSLTLQWD